MSPLSYEDRLTFVGLLETPKYEMSGYLNLEVDAEEMRGSEVRNCILTNSGIGS